MLTIITGKPAKYLYSDAVQALLTRHLGFATESRRANAAEARASELIADFCRNHAALLDDQALFAWHAMLMNGLE